MKVQLGFALPTEDEEMYDDDDDEVPPLGHCSPNWNDWDGGKIGGTPSWLNPRDIPTKPIYCQDCPQKTKMRFVTQLYCPLDDNDEAFHRSLYVFVCPNPCHSKPTKFQSSCNTSACAGGVRVFRNQLPRSNPFYPHDTTDIEDDYNDNVQITTVSHLSTDGWDIPLCRVCGQRGNGKCPKQKQWFCGKECQREHFKFVFHQGSNKDGSQEKLIEKENLSVPSIFKEMELVVEEEPTSSSSSTNDPISSSTNTSKSNKRENDLLEQFKKNAWFDSETKGNKNDKDDEIDDENLEQKDLNAMTGLAGGGTSDETTLAFFDRIDRVDTEGKSVKEQCLRYQRWDSDNDNNDADDNEDDNIEEDETNTESDSNSHVRGPLWISNQNIPRSLNDIPTCPYCQSERRFEFQLMPQMLNYLRSISAENGNKTNNSNNDDDIKKTNSNKPIPDDAKNALLAMSDIRERSGDENIKKEYIEKHEEALAEVKDQLLGGKNADDLDWGVISVFTCTKSCGAFEEKENGGKDLGAYREEFAWRQPPLD